MMKKTFSIPIRFIVLAICFASMISCSIGTQANETVQSTLGDISPSAPFISAIPESINSTEVAAIEKSTVSSSLNDEKSIPILFHWRALSIYNYLDAYSYPLRSDFLGGYHRGEFKDWTEFYILGTNITIYDYYDKHSDENGVLNYIPENDLTNVSDVFYYYDINGNHYKAHMKDELSIYVDGNMFCVVKCELVDVEELPKGEVYLGIFGEWDAMPRKWELIDELGSIKVDLDDNGIDDYVRVIENKIDIKSTFEFVMECNNNSYKLNSFLSNIVNPQVDGFFIWPLDANGDGVLEIFIIDVQFTDHPERIEAYSIDHDISKFNMFYMQAP